MSSTSIGGVYHSLFSLPTSSSYPTNLTPPATTTGYAVRGVSGSNFTYGDVSFVPLANLSGTFYWIYLFIYTTNKISSAVTIIPSQTAFSSQALICVDKTFIKNLKLFDKNFIARPWGKCNLMTQNML